MYVSVRLRRLLGVCFTSLFLLHVQVLVAESGSATSGWPEYGGNSAQCYSADKQIDRQNVRNLQVAWRFHTHAFDKPSPLSNHRASFEATAVLWKDTLYIDSPFDEVFALDAGTGKLKWSFDPQVDRQKPIYIVTSRGVALWHAARPVAGVCGSDVVLVATLDRRLIARDASSGAACPHFGTHGSVDLLRGVQVQRAKWYEFTSTPTVVGDTVVLGSTVADNQSTFAASGAVRGFDVRTGAQKWSWEPLRAVDGQRARTTGSGNAWSVISADVENDLVFVPTGSASVDFLGSNRPGDNRDANSLVALRASTGQRVWGFQFVHHDLWDYDAPAEPVLFTFRGRIPAVAIATKTSMLFVFNRLTGEPLYPIYERPVPESTIPHEHAWPTQPYSSLPPLTPLSFSAADVHLHNPVDQKDCLTALSRLDNKGLFTPPSTRGSLNFPGGIGGANWGSSAFDPTSGILYTRVSNLALQVRQVQLEPLGDSLSDRWQWLRMRLRQKLHLDPDLPQYGALTPDSGGRDLRDKDLESGTPYALTRVALEARSGTPCDPEPFGSIVAVNLNTGEKLWSVAHGAMAQKELGSIGVGGVIATGGRLLFAASTNDAYLRAYDSATGHELWRGALPVSANATPMTYTSKGRQFVVIAAGGHGFVGAGQTDEVVAFALPVRKR